MGALILLVIVTSTIWMGLDASGRDWSHNRFARHTWQWVVGGLGLWIVAFPVYLASRNGAPRKGSPLTASTPRADWSRPEAPSGAPPSRPSIPPPSASVPPPRPKPRDS
jgi:heme/copper-type cytochrome/quinol oxidase subunit 1